MASNPLLDQILAYADQASCNGHSSSSSSSSTTRSTTSSSSSSSSAASSSYSTFNYESCADNPNQCRAQDLAPSLPLDQYKLHVDPCPEVIRKKPTERVNYTQQVSVRYLKPPAPAPAGDILIQQLPDRQVAPAPPLHVRKQQPSQPQQPPLVIREAPPAPPPPVPGQYHEIPGKVIPPPARKVITEFLPPCPPKPQQIVIERWLPYEQPQQRVVYKPAKPPCIIPDPKNVTIIWSEPDVSITQCFINLGVQQADPQDYICRYGSSLTPSDQLPEVAVKFGARGGHPLAATHREPVKPRLCGDVQYLHLIQQNQHQDNDC